MSQLMTSGLQLELYTWLAPDAELRADDALKAHWSGDFFADFSADCWAANQGYSPAENQLKRVQNYFAEYHLEYYRQRFHAHFSSRLHACSLFATRVDAEIFRQKHPTCVSGKSLVCARSRGDYVVSFHDASWLNYLRLPHNLSLDRLDEIASYYWRGVLLEEIGPPFLDAPWREMPVIEALFQGHLNTLQRQHA